MNLFNLSQKLCIKTDNWTDINHQLDDQKLAIGRTTEVDIVLECGGRIAGVIVIYDGEAVVPFANQLYAVPICSLWKTAQSS